MKTVSEIASELGISTVTIYKKLNNTLEEKLTPHVSEQKINGKMTVTIDDVGVEIIREALNKPVIKPEDGSQPVGKDGSNPSLLKVIELLQSQLIEKDKQISMLMEQAKDLSDQLKTERERSHEIAIRHNDDFSSVANSIAGLLKNQQVLQSMDKKLEGMDKVLSAEAAAQAEPVPPIITVEDQPKRKKLFGIF